MHRFVLGLLRHASIQMRIVSLASCAVLFVLGALMGFFAGAAFAAGVLAGAGLGVLFWVETREPARRAEQFPLTNTEKVGVLPLIFLYAVFLGCVVERTADTPSDAYVHDVLGWAFFGSVGVLLSFNLLQLLRLCWYALEGGVPDRFLWRDRRSGRSAMRGLRGVVTERLSPGGRVRVRGELWNAWSADGEVLEAGREVIVLEVSGLTLRVGSWRDAPRRGGPGPESGRSPAESGSPAAER